MSPTFTPDFFNNVAAIAVVLIFTKFVTRRAHKARQQPKWPGVLPWLHIAAVSGAATAIGVSLWATDMHDTADWVRYVAWGGIATAGSFLIVDILIEEFF